MRTNICSVFRLCSVFLSTRQSLPSLCVDQCHFPAAHTSNQIHFLHSISDYPSLPTSQMPPYKFLSPNSRRGPPKNECHQQAGCGIGKIIVARHSWWWWWHRSSLRHSPAPGADIQGCAVGWFVLFSLGSITPAFFLVRKGSTQPPQQSVDELQSHPGWTLLPWASAPAPTAITATCAAN